MPNWRKLLVSGSDASLANLNVQNSVTASFFVGDGSNLSNINVSEVATVSDTFSSQTSLTVSHNFGTKNIIVSVYDENDSYFIPQSITAINDNQVSITFNSSESGRVVVAKGGHIVTGSIAEIATISDTFTSSTSYTVNHNFETKDVFVTVYDDTDNQIIPSSVSTPTTGSVNITFDSPTSGRMVIGKAGHLVTAAVPVTWDEISDKPVGIISGSSQITNLTTYKEDLSGNTSYTITHSLNEEYPIVQTWNTVTNLQEVPQEIETLNVNSIKLTFSNTFTGRVIIKK